MQFLGIDWGEAHDDLCLLGQDGVVLGARRIADGLTGVGDLHPLLAAPTGVMPRCWPIWSAPTGTTIARTSSIR